MMYLCRQLHFTECPNNSADFFCSGCNAIISKSKSIRFVRMTTGYYLHDKEAEFMKTRREKEVKWKDSHKGAISKINKRYYAKNRDVILAKGYMKRHGIEPIRQPLQGIRIGL